MTIWRIAYGILLPALVLTGLPALAQQTGHGEKKARQEKKVEKDQPTLPACPVMGEPINFAVSVETDEGPVFFCCNDCIPKYEANPDKYAAKVEAQRKALADRPKIQVVCPVSGQPVDRSVSVEHSGQKVYFCCRGCVGKFTAAPEKYATALANSYTYQTKCPVMGGEIDPQAFITGAGGRKIYFCCKGCEKKLLAEPSKYLPRLEAQGVRIPPEDLMKDAGKAKEAAGGHGSHEHEHGEHDHP
jgi:YHS domain-containing protein